MILFDEGLRTDFQASDVGVLVQDMQVVERGNAVH